MTFGTSKVFHKKFKFVVEIDGVVSAGFQKCSELSVEIAKIEQHEGGSLIPNKSPGRATYTDITLERGATQDQDLFDWMSEIIDAAANIGTDDPDFKRDLDIVQQSRSGNELRRWNVARAWPTKFVAGDWDNDADENVIESVTLTYDYFDIAS